MVWFHTIRIIFTISNIDKSKWLDYSVNLENKLKERFKSLENTNKISDNNFKSIYPIDTRPDIFYRLPKVHKVVIDNTAKFQPILSAVNTPVYELSQLLVSILSPLIVIHYTVKDSFTFAKEVINFDHNIFMASLDVESLFTNLPVDETIKNADGDLFSNNMYQGRLSKSELYYLLKLANAWVNILTSFCINKLMESLWVHLYGLPTLSNAFLCYYEKLWLDNCPQEFKPVVY